MKSYKNRFPFAVGAPSYVIPVRDDSVVANAKFLAGLFDMVQLLFFGRDHLDEVMSPRIMRDLKLIGDDTGLRFTAHLPADLGLLGASKASMLGSIGVIERILDETVMLGVEGYVLHLDGGSGPVELTQDRRRDFTEALGVMADRLGDAAAEIFLENISYDLAYFGDIINGSPFRVCMDAGHLMFHRHDPAGFIERLGHRIRQVHLHGVSEGRDHRAISLSDGGSVKPAADFLMKVQVPLVIEVYNPDDLEASAACLERMLND